MKKLTLALPALLLAMASHADWKYSESTDKMSGKTEKTATIVSDNSLSLQFPYSGTNHAFLVVRQHPRYGLDVILQVQKGQILCSSHGGCPIQVKFDNAPPIKFSGSPPADHNPTTVFFNSANRFISQAAKAKKILVQVNLYHAGAPVIEFGTQDALTWPTQAASKKK
ncbi:hypothetical protein [Pantoea sp. 18069]|uniref:hypothetical protein n=1 Tax=Pantoea sp. 18069 TaxID=2681415 RepID=UPI0013582A15|nr:hypothetical protein [Pantoea sp. 18069]